MFKRVTSLMIVLVFVLTMIGTSALAGNTCTCYCGNSSGTSTFWVGTGSRWLGSKLYLEQTKGTVAYLAWPSNWKTRSTYGTYYVYYTKDGGSQKCKTWNTKKLSLSLDKNSSYTVKVVPAPLSALSWRGSDLYWQTNSTWKVTGDKGVNLYICQQ